MKLKDLARRAKSPCPRCPYTLGLVHTLANPCPQCRKNGYKTYERFIKQRSGEMPHDK